MVLLQFCNYFCKNVCSFVNLKQIINDNNNNNNNIEQRNTEHRRNSGIPWNSGGTTEHYPGYQRNTPEQRKTKNNCSVFKRKFKTQNLNFQLKVENFLLLI